MFQHPEPIQYDNPVDIYAFGAPLTEEEKQFKSLVPADEWATRGGRCTVDRCSEKIWEDTPLCKKHAYDMWFKVELNKHIEEDRRIHEELKEKAILRQAALEEDNDRSERLKDQILRETWRNRAIAEETAVEFSTKPGTIYYLHVGDHIKIGYSSNLQERIKSYPPTSRLLAAHPGTVETERSMHNKFFNHLAHRREWFHPAPEIEEHIKTVHHLFPNHNKDLIH